MANDTVVSRGERSRLVGTTYEGSAMVRTFDYYGGDLVVGEIRYPLTHRQYLEMAVVLDTNAKVMIRGRARRRGMVDRWLANESDAYLDGFIPDPALPDSLTFDARSVIEDDIRQIQNAEEHVAVYIPEPFSGIEGLSIAPY